MKVWLSSMLYYELTIGFFYNGVAKLNDGQDQVENFGVSALNTIEYFSLSFTNITRWQLINLWIRKHLFPPLLGLSAQKYNHLAVDHTCQLFTWKCCIGQSMLVFVQNLCHHDVGSQLNQYYKYSTLQIHHACHTNELQVNFLSVNRSFFLSWVWLLWS